MNIGSSKSIWGHGDLFDGEEFSSPFSSWGMEGGFRCPEVGISEIDGKDYKWHGY